MHKSFASSTRHITFNGTHDGVLYAILFVMKKNTKTCISRSLQGHANSLEGE